MEPASLAIDKLDVFFGGVRAVEGVTLTFAPGKITGLIGPNGSGKSTTVNAVSGIVAPTNGKVTIDGIDITGKRPDTIARAGLARTWQIPRMPPELTVADIIRVPLSYIGSARLSDERFRTIDGLVELCRLSHVRDTACRNLSVAELRRLEIARAIACAPRVLMLDESMAGLSLEDSHAIIELVRNVGRMGITVIVIEHVMRVVTSLCEEVVVLNEGHLLASGKPTDVLAMQAVREAYLGKGFAQ